MKVEYFLMIAAAAAGVSAYASYKRRRDDQAWLWTAAAVANIMALCMVRK